MEQNNIEQMSALISEIISNGIYVTEIADILNPIISKKKVLPSDLLQIQQSLYRQFIFVSHEAKKFIANANEIEIMEFLSKLRFECICLFNQEEMQNRCDRELIHYARIFSIDSLRIYKLNNYMLKKFALIVVLEELFGSDNIIENPEIIKKLVMSLNLKETNTIVKAVGKLAELI